MPSDEETMEKSHIESISDMKSTESDADYFGPLLPPNYFKQKNNETKIYGPTLPVNFREKEELDLGSKSTSDDREEIIIGPELPEHLRCAAVGDAEQEEEGTPALSDDDDDDDGGGDNFGPSTTLMASGDAADYYKYKTAQNPGVKASSATAVERETWMTELPDKKGPCFGLFPRHFKTRIQTDKESDTSVWTDTPADKKKKEGSSKKDHKEILKRKRLEERDKEMEKLVRKAAKKLKKKEESLLEIHQKNMKAKQKEKLKKTGETVPERRPFDRNIDLQIPKFDDSQKRSILSKSQFLNDRFASGESKFL